MNNFEYNASILKINYPEELPVSARRHEIMDAMREHQVIIVCGETGSGKTTQLPKIALELGRGTINSGKLIGHTQPRRIAASTVAKRIAEELKTPLGDVVGFKVRFQDHLSSQSSVKVMTDGILLAEIQSDPNLTAYDTLIIDEAHERSLNIDFLLGYLRQLLPRRPDLKIIVTSATIDAERFANHFASIKGIAAPVIFVSGRLYPVEIRYQDFEESRDYGLNEAIAEAVDELWRHPHHNGDILIFLPGEREIRDATLHLQKHIRSQHSKLGEIEVLPLFARLSPQDQEKIFHPKGNRRIVLATNVAETSLTVPGIRYVIDSGLARVKRYSYRNKVDQLLVEPISQAAANQRAGRCGRVANGICIRLFSEDDFKSRPEFTDPEILRSSLAGVILRMMSIGLGAVDAFPFIEPPSGRAIADGYALLSELDAIDEQTRTLSKMGKMLASLPLDPRIGRMIIEAKSRHALAEVLVVAAAMSVQDVRDRPLEQQQKADEKHKIFDDERSEFMGTIRLWQWLEQLRGRSLFTHDAQGVHKTRLMQNTKLLPHQKHLQPKKTQKAPTSDNSNVLTLNLETVQAPQKLSNKKQEQSMREQFINPRRVREWRDIHTQLLTVVREHGWNINNKPCTYEQFHMALLSGLLGNIGCKNAEEEWYLGARGIKFWAHPGANLSKKPARWIIAAQLVQTSRLFGRDMAAIEPKWVEEMAGHLLKKQLMDPHWEKKAADVVALERATLYGIVIYSNRKVNYGHIDVQASREIFIREALVAGDWDCKLPFFTHNRNVISQIHNLEHKARRQDLLVDDELIYTFYDQHIPQHIVSGHTFEVWYRQEAKKHKKHLYFSREELMRHEAAGITTQAYPRTIRLGAVDCDMTYLHEPGHTRDGMTVSIPIYALNQVSEERCEWLVPGMLKEKVLALLKCLHQRPRSRLMPLDAFAQNFIDTHEFGQGSLISLLLQAVRQKTQLDVKRTDFRFENLKPYVFMNFAIIDEHGRQLGMGRDLTAIKAEHGRLARHTFQALATLKNVASAHDESNHVDNTNTPLNEEKTNHIKQTLEINHYQSETRYTNWDFGELPEIMEIHKGKQTLVGFPALVDDGDAVHIEVYDEPDIAAKHHRAGLRRLISLQIKDALKYLEKNIPNLQSMSMLYMNLGTAEELRQQITDVALDRAFLVDILPIDAQGFTTCVTQGRPRMQLIAQEVARQAESILIEYAAILRKLKDTKTTKTVQDDIQAQLGRLLSKKFILETPWAQLQHVPRYLKAIGLRLEKYAKDPVRDERHMNDIRPLEQRYYRRIIEQRGKENTPLRDYRWMLEELRVSLFAQELKTPYPVSIKRLEKLWSQLI